METVPSEIELRQFIGDLARQREHYRGMTELGRRQIEAIARDDHEAVSAIADRKVATLQEVERIDRRAGPLKQRWPAVAAAIPEALRREVEREVEAIRAVLAELMAQEDEGRRAMELRRAQTRQRLQAAGDGRRAGRAYAGQAAAGAPQDARFVDRRS